MDTEKYPLIGDIKLILPVIVICDTVGQLIHVSTHNKAYIRWDICAMLVPTSLVTNYLGNYLLTHQPPVVLKQSLGM